jgi:DnaJ-class molecular chaperone
MVSIGLKLTVCLVFFSVAKNIWSYKPMVHKVKYSLEDYYTLFDIEEGFSDDDLRSSFQKHLDILNQNSNLNFENKLIITRKLQDAFDVLISPETRTEYERKYSEYLQEVELVEQKNKQQKVGLIEDVKGMLIIKEDRFSKIKTNLGLGILVAFILDLIMLSA